MDTLDDKFDDPVAMMPCLGHIAFNAYNEHRGGVNYEGKRTPPWAELPEGIREAWEVAAQAVADKIEPRQAIVPTGNTA